MNLDRLAEIRTEKVGGRHSERLEARIYGIVSATERSLDVELCRGSIEAIASIWERWERIARPGANLARAVELEELEVSGRDPGELFAAPEPELVEDYPRAPFTDGRFTGHDHVSIRGEEEEGR